MTTPTTETGIVELLPCPFCGGEGEMVNDGDDAGPRVNCCGCDMEGPRAYWVDYESMSIANLEAVRQWNTRAAIAAMPDSTQLLQTAWRPIETAPKDGSEILILAHGMAIQARYEPGRWSDDTPVCPAEYDGAVWCAFDDAMQFEIEEAPEGDLHGPVTHWRPLPEPPAQFRAQEQRS